MQKLEGKRFKFYSRAYRERKLAKVLSLSGEEVYYKSLNKPELAYEAYMEKSKLYQKLLSNILKHGEYVKTLQKKIAELQLLLKAESNEVKCNKIYKKITKLDAEYDFALGKVYMLEQYFEMIRFSNDCQSKGEVLPYENKDSKYYYIFSYDILKLADRYDNFSEDLSYIFYRALYVKGGMDLPMPVTKEQYEEFLKATELVYGDANYFKYETPNTPFREKYDYGRELEAKIAYESVFPEFGFKYEDRQKDAPSYTVEFDNEDFYDDYK